MNKTELTGSWRQVRSAPGDHACVQVDADISTGLDALLNELPGNPAAAATKVENDPVPTFTSLGKDIGTAWVVECGGVDRTNQGSHVQRGYR
jgi:hypothetical protein